MKHEIELIFTSHRDAGFHYPEQLGILFVSSDNLPWNNSGGLLNCVDLWFLVYSEVLQDINQEHVFMYEPF